MKKFLLFALILALMLSLCCVSAAAELDVDPDWWFLSGATARGAFAGESDDAFAPVGEAWIPWEPDVAAKTDMTDGDVADWKATGWAPFSINENRMVSWIGGQNGVRDPGMPDDWGIEFTFMADADYLYLVFDVTDSNFTYGSSEGAYDGDAIQLSIDFGGRLEEMLEHSPEDLASPKGLFYSFSCEEDGAPIRIMRQESDQDGWLSEENGDGVKGSARKTEQGWSAEIALSWQQLYDDYTFKAWDDSQIYVGGDQALSLDVNMTLTYLNRTETAGVVTWAASTTRGLTDADGTPLLTWTAVDNGIHLRLRVDDGVSVNCTGVREMCIFTTIPPEIACTEPAGEFVTEPAWEPATEPALEPDIEVPDIEFPGVVTAVAVPDNTEANSDEELDSKLAAVLEKYGCSATAGFGTIALLAAAAAVLACKKKD